MQNIVKDVLKTKRETRCIKYAELNEEQSIQLLAELIANQIIKNILYAENRGHTINAANGKKVKAA